MSRLCRRSAVDRDSSEGDIDRSWLSSEDRDSLVTLPADPWVPSVNRDSLDGLRDVIVVAKVVPDALEKILSSLLRTGDACVP